MVPARGKEAVSTPRSTLMFGLRIKLCNTAFDAEFDIFQSPRTHLSRTDGSPGDDPAPPASTPTVIAATEKTETRSRTTAHRNPQGGHRYPPDEGRLRAGNPVRAGERNLRHRGGLDREGDEVFRLEVVHV